MKKVFNPIFDRVLIKRDDSSLLKKMTKSGLELPDKLKDSYQSSLGTLLKAGHTCCDEVKEMVGKTIAFAKYSGDDFEINGETFFLASEADIFGTIEEVED